MKVVSAFSGISYGNPGKRDWRRCVDNIERNIIKPFATDTYITTYHNDYIDDLVLRYKPKKYNLLDYVGSDTRTTYKKTLELLLDVDFDIAITTRFDIRFNEDYKPSDYNIDYDKINLLFKEQDWWNNNRYTCDPQLFCIFPKKYIIEMINTTQELYDYPHREGCMDLHPFYNYITKKIDSSNINFIFDEESHSHDNKYYILDRWSPWWPNFAGL